MRSRAYHFFELRQVFSFFLSPFSHIRAAPERPPSGTFHKVSVEPNAMPPSNLRCVLIRLIWSRSLTRGNWSSVLRVGSCRASRRNQRSQRCNTSARKLPYQYQMYIFTIQTPTTASEANISSCPRSAPAVDVHGSLAHHVAWLSRHRVFRSVECITRCPTSNSKFYSKM